MTLGCLTGQTGQLGGIVADGWCDAAPVEPLCTLHNLVEVELFGLCLGNGAVGTVVDHLRRAHRSSRLGIVQAYAVAATNDVLCVHTIAAQGVDGYLPDLVLRQFRHEAGLMAIVGHADRHVGLAAAGDDTE